MLVEPGPGERQVGAAQLGVIDSAYRANPHRRKRSFAETAQAIGSLLTKDAEARKAIGDAFGAGFHRIWSEGRIIWIRSSLHQSAGTRELDILWALRESLSRVERHLPGRFSDPDSSEPQQPSYVSGPLRSVRPEIGVLIGICTHLGCSPLFRPEPDAVDMPDWPGGFFCPCHGSFFDLAGRVFRNVPAPLNLEVPPYRFEGDDIIVGEDEETA